MRLGSHLKNPTATHEKRLETLRIKWKTQGGKRCCCCKIIKPLSDFYHRSGKHSHLYRGSCKLCEAKNQSKIRGRICFNEKRRSRRKIDTWMTYLIKKYGEHPPCQCCGKTLTWKHGNRGDSVVLDHRLEGEEPIKKGFYTWANDHALSDKNIQTFELCHFGILCRKCNILIPTIGRREWFNQLGKYLKTE